MSIVLSKGLWMTGVKLWKKLIKILKNVLDRLMVVQKFCEFTVSL